MSTRLSILDDREKEILKEVNEEHDEVAYHSIICHNCIDVNNEKMFVLEGQQFMEAMDDVHNTVNSTDGEGESRKSNIDEAFRVFQKSMLTSIARAHMESTIPQ